MSYSHALASYSKIKVINKGSPKKKGTKLKKSPRKVQTRPMKGNYNEFY